MDKITRLFVVVKLGIAMFIFFPDFVTHFFAKNITCLYGIICNFAPP